RTRSRPLPHRCGMDSRVRRFRPGIRLPDRWAAGVDRAAPSGIAHQGPARRGGAGRPVQRHLPARITWGVAAHRPHRAGDLVRGPGAAGTAAPRGARAVPGGRMSNRAEQARVTRTPVAEEAPGLEVLATGPLATVQDLGRPGLSHLGVGTSGAADRRSFRLANRLVGNSEDAAGIEFTFGGLAFRACRDLTVAITGAPCRITVDGRREAVNSVLRVPAGAELRAGAPTTGLRSYLAVRGGIAVAPVLGSRATDVLSGLGPAPLQPGDVLPVGPPP